MAVQCSYLLSELYYAKMMQACIDSCKDCTKRAMALVLRLHVEVHASRRLKDWSTNMAAPGSYLLV